MRLSEVEVFTVRLSAQVVRPNAKTCTFWLKVEERPAGHPTGTGTGSRSSDGIVEEQELPECTETIAL